MGNSQPCRKKRVTPDAKSLGRWVKASRKEAGYTQEELAGRTRCKKAYISKVENATPHSVGSHAPSPTLDFLHKLSVAFGVSIAEPLAALGYLKTEAGMTERSHPVRILRYYNELSPEDRALAEEMVKTLWAQRRIKTDRPDDKPKTKKPKVA